MKRNAAENTVYIHKQLFDALPGLGDQEFEAYFPHVVHASMMDRHSANLKSTNKLRIDDSADGRRRQRLASNCDVHPTAGVCTKTWVLSENDISGLLALAIAERGAGRFDDLVNDVSERCVLMLRIERSLF